MNRHVRWSAVLATHLLVAPAIAGDGNEPQTARLHFDPQCILEQVAGRLNVTLQPEAPFPAILFESATPLEHVQNNLEAQWGMRPPVFVNAYAIEPNEIYLVDDPRHYGQHDRTLDDALAHAFVHYLQVVYLDADLNGSAIAHESEAAAVEQWFRESHTQLNRAARAGQP